MPKKVRPQRINLKSLFRLIIFLIIFFFLISWFSQNQPNKILDDHPTKFIDQIVSSPDILGVMYSKLPKDSRSKLENFNQLEIGKFISNTSETIRINLEGFPQKQIKEIKKAIIRSISDDMIRSIDEK